MRRFIVKMKECMQDNRGLTLIELLVAITILGLASAPLLHGFLTSANTSVKSQKMGDVTMVAQNVMEVIAANKFDTIVPADSTDLKAAFGATDVNYYNLTGSTYDSPGTSRPGTSGAYHLGLKGISAGNKTYNAMIDIDPEPYNSSINDDMLGEYASMDAVFQVPIVPISATTTDRVITMDVVKVSDGEIDIALKYDVAGAVKTFETYKYDVESGKRLSIYLLYYPNYNGTDKIVINNLQGLDFDLFLVKKRDTSLALTELDNYELGYHCTVQQHLQDSTKNAANIYSNIEERLSYTARHSTAEKEMGLNHISYKVIHGAEDSALYVNGNFGDVNSDLEAALIREEKQERAYKVTVRIFSNEDTDYSGEALCTMTGTVLK